MTVKAVCDGSCCRRGLLYRFKSRIRYQGGGNYQNQGFNQGGFNAPQSQPAQGSEPNFGDDFDMGDFSDLDGSEDDLPF